jgi:D-3-phosphoglycerate dehydrogenase
LLRETLLEKYQDVRFNDAGARLAGDSLVEFLGGATKAIVGLERLDRAVLTRVPTLKVVSKFGVGLDSLDLDAFKQLGIKLAWSPGVNKRSVAELVVALMIASLRQLIQLNQITVSGSWKQVNGYTLSGKTIGIIGCNNIGKDLLGLLRPWGCNFLVYDIVKDQEIESFPDVHYVGLDELLVRSDVVTLHLPLTESTKNILSRDQLMKLKKNAVIINTSRGGLVDEVALKDMLKKKEILGAAFDVFQNEPPVDLELLRLENFIATPHIGGSTSEAIVEMGLAAIHGLD